VIDLTFTFFFFLNGWTDFGATKMLAYYSRGRPDPSGRPS